MRYCLGLAVLLLAVAGYFLLSGASRGELDGLERQAADGGVGHRVDKESRADQHRKLAEELGAVWTGASGDDPGALMDSSIIFAPAGQLVPEALKTLRKGGTLVLAGIHMSPIPEFDYSLIWGERVIRSVANATRQDAEEMLHLAAQIPVRTEVQTFPLDQANDVLLKLKRSEIDGAAVLDINSMG